MRTTYPPSRHSNGGYGVMTERIYLVNRSGTVPNIEWFMERVMKAFGKIGPTNRIVILYLWRLSSGQETGPNFAVSNGCRDITQHTLTRSPIFADFLQSLYRNIGNRLVSLESHMEASCMLLKIKTSQPGISAMCMIRPVRTPATVFRDSWILMYISISMAQEANMSPKSLSLEINIIKDGLSRQVLAYFQVCSQSDNANTIHVYFSFEPTAVERCNGVRPRSRTGKVLQHRKATQS